MTTLSWYGNRIRAMSGAEISYRLEQALRKKARRLLRGAPSGAPRVAPPATRHPIVFFDRELGWPGEVDWHRDYSTGKSSAAVFYGDLDYRDEAQVGDSKYTWELNRHQFIVPWAVGYRDTGDEDHARAVVSLIQDWIGRNPPHVGINWTSSLEMAIRILNWGIALDLCASSRHARDGREEIGRSVSAQADFIRHTLSRYSSANNHLMGELVGLLAAGAFFPEADGAAKAASAARSLFLEEAFRQNHPDGVNREQAVFYHHYTLEYILTGVELFGRIGWAVDPGIADLCHRMLGFLEAMTDDRGAVFEIGDRDDGLVTGLNVGTGVGAFESLLWSGWVLFKDEVLGAHAARIALGHGRAAAPDRRTVYWHGVGDGTPDIRHRSGRRLFPQGGYLISEDDGFRLLFKAGPFGYPSIAAHAHCDQLSVLLARGDLGLLTDAGTGVYHTDERWRRFFKGTSAHNTVGVDGLDQAEYAGSFLWSTHADGSLELLADTPEMFRARGTHEGYRRLRDPVGHERTVEWARGLGYRVSDRLTAADRHRFELYWNFAPEVRLDPVPGDHGGRLVWRVSTAAGPVALLLIGASVPVSAEVIVGDVDRPAGFESRSYRRWRPAPHLRATATCTGGAAFETLIMTEPALIDAPAASVRAWG
jgi:hypothetical protein